MSAIDLDPFDADPLDGNSVYLSESNARELLTPAQQFQRFLETPVIQLVGITVLFLAVFSNLVNVQVDKDTVALDKQVLFKLAVLAGCGIYGAFGFLNDYKVRRLLLTFPGLWLVLILGLYFLTALTSITQTESLASAVSIACVLLMTVTALVQLGSRTVLTTVFHAMSAFVFLSWVAYFVAPQIGIFEEPLSDGQFAVRMSGLSHPNTLGQFSGLLIVLAIVLYRSYGQRFPWRLGIVLLAAGALVASLSRTSMLATIVAIAAIHRKKWMNRQAIIYFSLFILLGVIGLIFLSIFVDVFAVVESKLASFSKSGDIEELTSATGRLDIWAYAIQLIGERPLMGYGAATSKYYLAEYSLYTHNMILNIAFSAGVFGGIAAVCMCFGRVVELIKYYHPVADALVVFILVNGFFENVIFSILAGMPTIVWTIGLCLPGLDQFGPANGEKTVASGGAERGSIRDWRKP